MVGNEIQTMSLKDIKNEIKKLNNQLETYLRLKEIHYEKATGTTARLKEVITSKTNFIFDRFTHYIIKDEEYDDKIYSLEESINAYQKLWQKEIDRLRQFDDVPLITYLREEENMSWKEIDKLLNFSQDYSKVKYSRYKKNKIDNV